MEGFVSDICQFRISLSVVTAPIKSIPETRTYSWALLAWRRWLNSSVSISVDSKIPGSLMRTLRISHPESKRTFPTLCNIVVSIGQIIFASLQTLAIWVCGKTWGYSSQECMDYFGLKY